MWDIPMKKGNILHEKNTDGDFSAVDGWIFSKQKCEEHQKGNHLQQSPLLKWELVRLGQQPPSNHLQQSPQAKGDNRPRPKGNWSGGTSKRPTITRNNRPRPRGNWSGGASNHPTLARNDYPRPRGNCAGGASNYPTITCNNYPRPRGNYRVIVGNQCLERFQKRVLWRLVSNNCPAIPPWLGVIVGGNWGGNCCATDKLQPRPG